MSLDNTAFVERPRRTRAAVSNGSLLPAGIDGRSATARRFRDVTEALCRELRNGEALSIAEMAMARQAAAVIVRIEALQAAIVAGEPVDDDTIVRLSNTAHRLLSGFRDRSRGKTPPGIDALLKTIEGRP